jgi:hypothetical protein
LLIDRLQAVVDNWSQLSPQQQEQLANEIEDAIDEALWTAQFAYPRSEVFFDELVADAKKGPLRPLPTPADMGDEDGKR